MRVLMPALLCALFSTSALVSVARAEGRSIIVLDGSGSMWGQIDGRPKLEIAREALGQVLQGIPPETELGLMAYGHRSKGECDDIELIVPPAAGSAAAISTAANGMKFLGKTPLTEAVRRAASELRATEEKATVILITDGIETCEADPCAVATELEAQGIDFTAHVVGFGLTAEEGQQVACLAENTGGQYIEAKDAGALVEALKTTVAVAPEPAPEPTPTPPPAPAVLEVNFAPTLLLAPGIAKPDDNSQVSWSLHAINADGTTGERVDTHYNDAKTFVEPGQYRMITTLDLAQDERDLTITADSLTAPEVVLNAARVILHPKAEASAPVDSSAAVKFTLPDGRDTTEYGSTRTYMPAGAVTVLGTMGSASVTETLTLAPGEQLERDLVIGSGLAVVDGFYVPGMKMETTQHAVEILLAKKALDGSQEKVTTNYGPGQQFQLAPGDYVARVTLDAAVAETPFTVKVGERSDVAVTLNAGVLAVTAAGAETIEVFAGKADINGERQKLSYGYDPALNTTLPAGEVLIVVKRGEAMTETPAIIKAGERTEVTVP